VPRAANLNPGHRLGEPLPRRVAVLRALQLGDLLVAVPAFRALRSALPAAEIVLIGLPWAETFVRRYAPYLDGFHALPGYPGLPERLPQLDRLPAFLEEMRAERFDLVVQLHGSGTITNPLAVLLGGRRTAGFFVPGQFCPDPERFLPWPLLVPELWRPLRLLDFLGVPPRGEHLEFPLRLEDEKELRSLDEAGDLRPGGYACIHPGARAAERRWPPERFAAVADALAGRGLRVVLTGSRDETALTRAVADAMRAEALDLAGQTSLGAVAALLRGARLLVCNDTGVSHLAAALRVPSVVVLPRRSELESWPPLDHVRHRVVSGVVGVEPGAVLAEAEELLDYSVQYGQAVQEALGSPGGATIRCPSGATEGFPDGPSVLSTTDSVPEESAPCVPCAS
jgi:ADP-heptose:LPS heptosyltransferase